jgi:hypothetical protein
MSVGGKTLEGLIISNPLPDDHFGFTVARQDVVGGDSKDAMTLNIRYDAVAWFASA